MDEVVHKKLVSVVFIDDQGKVDDSEVSQSYPFNPNGSPYGITGLCTEDGRHLAMMPHPERTFLKWRWASMPGDMERSLEASPWIRMFQNARAWCDEVK